MSPPRPASETRNKAAIYRGEYADLVAVPRKMNTAAEEDSVVDAIVLKKTEFDQIEAVEAQRYGSALRRPNKMVATPSNYELSS
jgi:hypothetical protein